MTSDRYVNSTPERAVTSSNRPALPAAAGLASVSRTARSEDAATAAGEEALRFAQERSVARSGGRLHGDRRDTGERIAERYNSGRRPQSATERAAAGPT